jgi:hypothetical protein
MIELSTEVKYILLYFPHSGKMCPIPITFQNSIAEKCSVALEKIVERCQEELKILPFNEDSEYSRLVSEWFSIWVLHGVSLGKVGLRA